MGLIRFTFQLLQDPRQVVSTWMLLALLIVVLVESNLLTVPFEGLLPIPQHANYVDLFQLLLLDRVFVELCRGTVARFNHTNEFKSNKFNETFPFPILDEFL